MTRCSTKKDGNLPIASIQYMTAPFHGREIGRPYLALMDPTALTV
jgi:hypothetical protein